MFIHRVLLHPAVGRAPALRDLLVKGAQGQVLVVAQRIWGEAPVFSLNRAFESLDALEEWRRGFQPNPAVAEALAQPPSSELWEVPGVQPAPGTAPAPRYTLRFTFHGALGGHLRELRETVERFAAALPATGRASSVSVRVTGGPASIAVVRGFDSLSEIAKQRAGAIADPKVQEHLAQLASLVGTPVQTPEWFEILAAPA